MQTGIVCARILPNYNNKVLVTPLGGKEKHSTLPFFKAVPHVMAREMNRKQKHDKKKMGPVPLIRALFTATISTVAILALA